VKLSPYQISNDWEAIASVIEYVLPPLSSEKNKDRMNNLLKTLIEELADCWILSKDGGTIAVFITNIIVDQMTNDRCFNIHSLYGYRPLNMRLWTMLFEIVEKKAIELKCNKVVGYSSVPRIIELAESFGWETDCRFISKEV